VSHLKERKEKNCLNCQTTVIGRYCHECGQENLEPKETVWHLVQHFFNDITHFDGKFFSTVKLLLRKPGFLSAEYIAGRRMSYLNPIRMYVFTSAFFFIILFSLKKPEDMVNSKPDTGQGLAQLEKTLKSDQRELVHASKDDREDLNSSIDKLSREINVIRKRYSDTATRKFNQAQLAGLMIESVTDSLKDPDLTPAARAGLAAVMSTNDDEKNGTSLLGFNTGDYKTIEDYDSAERKLPDSLRDGWLKHKVMDQLIVATQEYHEDKRRYKEHFMENLLHSFPKILFWSLPFFALVLNILYFRHKQYFYVSHGIFAIHVYCATFILILAAILLNALSNWLGWGWFKVVSDLLQLVLWFYIMIYLYKAMRGFYKQRRAKTFVKYFIACSVAFVVNLILLLIFLLLSAIYI
jgi:Protein of unknown function (DUF3667)